MPMPAKKKAVRKPAKKASKKPKPIPSGYSTIMPGFATTEGAKAVAFYTKVFGAKVKSQFAGPNGAIQHCELKFGDTVVMFGEPRDGTTYPMHASIYVKNVDDVVKKAVEAGAVITRPVENQFYGERGGTVLDPFGNEWFVMTHVEDVSKKELDRRMGLMMQGKPWK
jgi:PhnB protein